MANVPPLPAPDPDLVARVMTAIDEGVRPEVQALCEKLAAGENEVRAALAAVHVYHAVLRDERTAATAPLVRSDGSLAPGTRLGDFVIDGEIGAGAMGVVYRARQVSLGDRAVALKVLPPSLARRDPKFAERFRREATLAAAIHHPNLAEVYGIETGDDGLLCFAMRLVEGRTLQEVLIELAHRHDGPVRRSSAEHVRCCAQLARGIADALAEVHARGLVHRDVKPSNVILEGAGDDPEAALRARPVLVDFGLLRPAGDTELTGTRTLLGTPAYASHETQLGRDVDARADVFSLGAVLHDLLTSTSPGTRGPATSGLGDVREVNPAVDAGLTAIVDMALQERRELRYAHGGAMREDLDRYLRGNPVVACPTGALGRLRLWARRSPLIAVKVLASLAAVALAFAVLLSAAAWSWNLTSLARTARTKEGDGDLVGARDSYQKLLNSPGTDLMPWLADDVQRARLYRDGPSPFQQALIHLCTATAGLDARHISGADPTSPPEHELELVYHRFAEALLDPQLASCRDAVWALLLRDIEVHDRTVRRVVALDTIADILLAQPRGPQAIPNGLCSHLIEVVAKVTTCSDRTARQAAIAALGGIRTTAAFEALVRIQAQDLDSDTACLAGRCSLHLFRWLQFDRRTEFDAIGPTLLQDWLRGLAFQSRKHAQDTCLLSALRHAAWWEREQERLGTHRRLDRLDDHLRSQVDSARQQIEQEWQAAKGDPDRIRSDVAFEYLAQTIGLTIIDYTAEVWSHSTDKEEPLGEPRERPDPSEPIAFGGIDFGPIGTRTPELRGTVFAASCRAARLTDWETADLGTYLCLHAPGHSLLSVRSIVPEHAIKLTITIRHIISTRPPLRTSGQAAFCLSIKDTAWSFRSLVPESHETHGRAESAAIASETTLDGLNEIDVVLDYEYGNTTYRVLGMDLNWELAQ